MVRRRNQALGRIKSRSLRVRGSSATPGAAQINGMFLGTVTWDPGNLIDAAGESKDVTVTGAALGDFCLPSLPVDLQGITISAAVKAANTVTVRLQNESGGAIDLASVTAKVLVIKASAAT